MNRNEKNVNKLTMLGMMTALVFVSNYLRITMPIAQTAASLLYNAPLQQAMIQAQAKTINAYAARDAIDLALERCTSPGV